jgi:hypothetical protein
MTSESNQELISEITEIVSKHSAFYSKGFIKLVLIRTDDSYNIHSGIISFLPKGESIEEGTRDYGDILFLTETFAPRYIKNRLEELSQKGTLIINRFESLPATGKFQVIHHIPSKNRMGYLYSLWPRYYIEYNLTQSRFPVPHEPLAKPGLQIYPDGRKAITDFLDLRTSNPTNSILIQMPKYKLRIENMVISGKTVRLTITSNVNLAKFIVKLYADMEIHSVTVTERFYAMHSPELKLIDNHVEYTFDNDFEYILGLVMDNETGETIDFRGYSFGWGPQEGVTLDLQELEIQEIIRRGENLQVEFKQNLDNSDRILKTVVAFANTRGGRIFMGVSDDTRIIGFDPDKNDQVSNLITGNLDPLPNFSISNVLMNKIPISIIEVQEGDNKPYSHRELGFFVRSAGSNRSATRTDMDKIYEEKQSGVSYFRSHTRF